jgi:hypothetical protein
LIKKFPWYTPYQFAGNKPIIATDLDGLEENVIIHWYDDNNKYVGSTIFRINNVADRIQSSGTLIINLHKNKQDAVNTELAFSGMGSTTKPLLFNVNAAGAPTSLKGGKILTQSKNKHERDLVNEINNTKHTQIDELKVGLKPVFFDNPDNTETVDPGIVRAFKHFVEQNPEYNVEVTGYASQEPGVPVEHNQTVADERGEKVKSEITPQGTAVGRVVAKPGIVVTGNSNNTEAGRKANRKAVIKTVVPRNSQYD